MTRVRAFQFEAKARNGVGFMPLSLSSHTARINPPASNTPPSAATPTLYPRNEFTNYIIPSQTARNWKQLQVHVELDARAFKNQIIFATPPLRHLPTVPTRLLWHSVLPTRWLKWMECSMKGYLEVRKMLKVMRNRSILIGVKGTLYNRWRREIILDRTYSVNRLINLLGIFLSDITLQGVLRVKQHLFHLLLHLPPSVIVCPSSYCRGLRFVVVCR